jgi:tripartite-type tricarboxylate transporter receptor subunit TctC
VPTVAESGNPGFAADQWYGLFAPAGTPEAILRKVEADVRAVTDETQLRGQMWQRGAEIQYTPGRQFAGAVKKDWQRWQVVAKATGAQAQ